MIDKSVAAGPGARPQWAEPDLGARFEAVFRGPLGQVVQQRWVDAALAVAFEESEPISAFPVIPGRRWGPGMWWSSTTGRHVAAGSNAMRVQLMVLDRDPRVVGLAGRPVRLLWRDVRGRVRSWVPQLFARYDDGTALVADCPSHPVAGGERAQKAAAVMVAACEQVGWTYRRLEPLDEVLAANLRWLAGYRHPRNLGRPELAAAVQEAFARPRPLIEGVEAVGDPIEILPCVFHTLWRGHLDAPLQAPLHERVLVGPGTVTRRGEAMGRTGSTSASGASAGDTHRGDADAGDQDTRDPDVRGGGRDDARQGVSGHVQDGGVAGDVKGVDATTPRGGAVEQWRSGE